MQPHAFLGQPVQSVQKRLDEAGIPYTVSYTYPNKRDEMGDDLRVVRVQQHQGAYVITVSGFCTAVKKSSTQRISQR